MSLWDEAGDDGRAVEPEGRQDGGYLHGVGDVLLPGRPPLTGVGLYREIITDGVAMAAPPPERRGRVRL